MSRDKMARIETDTWDDVAAIAGRFAEQKGPWFFRGHRDAEWRLQTARERALRNVGKDPGKNRNDERRMILDFRHHAHRFPRSMLERMDPDFEELEPLLLLQVIQQHGGFTRLLDFTRSLWAAVFFALEVVPGPASASQAVWAINARQLWNKAMKSLRPGQPKPQKQQASQRNRIAYQECRKCIALGEHLKAKAPDGGTPMALPLEPLRPNARMASQRGCFIFPLLLHESFEENLFATFGIKDRDTSSINPTCEKLPQNMKETPIIKLILPAGDVNRSTGLRRLANMNVSAATLFPGLEGSARATSYNMLKAPDDPPRQATSTQAVPTD